MTHDPSRTRAIIGPRILVTSATTYMGPAIAERLRAGGADVIADEDRLIEPSAPAALVNDVDHSMRSSPT